MREDRATVRLGDVASIQTGFPFKSSGYSDDLSDPKLLRGDNIAQGPVRWDGVKRWPKATAIGIDQYWLREGDVILAMDRPWIEAGLKYCVIQSDDLPCLLVQRVARMRGQKDLDDGFLRYVIGSPSFTQHVLAVQTGTAVPHISTKQIQSFQFDLPLLSEQRSIAATLGALDDKIELNRKMNATLEAMARALFRDWFVNFGPTRAKMEGRDPYLSPNLWSLFPDRLDAEGKPEGWEVSSIGALTRRITKGTTPTKQQITAAPDTPSINFLRVNNLSDDGKLLLGNTVQIAQSVHEIALKRSMLEQDDLLYSIAGTIGRVTKTPREILPANVNQAIAIIRADPELAPPNYLLMWLSNANFQNELHSNIVQAVQANLSLGMLSGARILAPPRKTLMKLFQPIDALLKSKAHNERESRTLAQTRDLLLPRLMSGELRVTDALPELETA